MNYWTNDHTTLLNALRANAVVPVLYRRLALERLSPDDAEVRRLRGWAACIRRDAGWRVIERVLDRPAAWPAVWEEATNAGFSPVTDHHHALLFGRFCEQLVNAQDWETADWTWRQSVKAWTRVFSSDYPGQLFDDLAPKLSDDGPGKDEMLAGMLDALVERRRADLREASGVTKPGRDLVIERRRLRFASRALSSLADLAESTRDDYGTLRHLAQLAQRAHAQVSAEVVTRFEKLAEEVDFSDAKGDQLLGHFRWAASFFDVVGNSESGTTALVSQVVEACWALRRVGRDDIPEFRALLDLGAPFNQNLFARLKSLESAFGHNSRCADFLVFVGEQATDAARRKEIFASGLEICPGHRNSAMLLSYEHLTDAERILTQLALAPSVVSIVPGTSQRIDRLLREAEARLSEAESVYPYNERLPEVRESLEREAERLDVSL